MSKIEDISPDDLAKQVYITKAALSLVIRSLNLDTRARLRDLARISLNETQPIFVEHTETLKEMVTFISGNTGDI